MKIAAIAAFCIAGLFCTLTVNACGMYMSGTRPDQLTESDNEALDAVFGKCSQYEKSGYLEIAINLLLEAASNKTRTRVEKQLVFFHPDFMQDYIPKYRVRLSSGKIVVNLRFRF